VVDPQPFLISLWGGTALLGMFFFLTLCEQEHGLRNAPQGLPRPTATACLGPAPGKGARPAAPNKPEEQPKPGRRSEAPISDRIEVVSPGLTGTPFEAKTGP
jgi:hypothetical protein